ncbi:MAG: hypothetical protein KIY12_08340 [Thermoplasmata archaeon]|uniref:Uncharacterized protein n=1 Tax=Candidatus Sysuiplasma superficiale TaxID=2823368 RepID=A0A8J7YPY2_9ARCH|nr:hypothetical protein [Candidatus Sysuiplasma superficiale]
MTGASARLFSPYQGEVGESSYDLDYYNFYPQRNISIAFVIREADYSTTFTYIQATSYGEITTMTILVLIGLYHGCHILHAILEKVFSLFFFLWIRARRKQKGAGYQEVGFSLNETLED